MRPLIHPALARVWRDSTTIQIGLDPARALVLSGLTTVETAVLRGVNGRSDLFMLRSLARDQGGDTSAVDRLLEVLRAGGVLVDQDRLPPADRLSGDPDAGGEQATDPRAPDRASLGLLTGALDGGAGVMRARRDRWVEVRGAGRVGAQISRLLDAAGIGRTTAVDPQHTTPDDLAPGGLAAHQIGVPREAAAQALLHGPRAAPADAETHVSDGGQVPDLVVLASPPGAVTVGGAEALLASRIPHIAARVVELTGIAGPLVIPGRTSCLRCLELHRRDRDPAWPRVAAQADHRPASGAACDITLATQVAALVAQHVLAHLDGFSPATIDGTVEFSLPYGLPRRRSWRPHPACGCTWS